ncbi:YaiO family outer membrane beta-barrel protein [Gracilimonas sp.]|uniref:YaiO family outer membrane beta-barrel protein n=1 Tax=Gracilimonas sp. TaxID=1974203 RepID=UPI003BACF03F
MMNQRLISTILLFAFLLGIKYPAFAQPVDELNQSVTAQSEYVFVNNLDNWVRNQAFYSFEGKSVTWIGRLRHTYRFQQHGTFLSAVAYPEFSEDMYAYLMAGTSPDNADIYPDFRASGTLYRNVGNGLVLGPGMQYIRAQNINVYIYSLKANWYTGSYLLIGSPSVQFIDGEKSLTVSGSVRKYLTEPNSFISMTVGGGQNPDDTFFSDDFANIFTSFFASSRIQYPLSEQWILNAGLKFRKDTYSSGIERTRTGIQTGITVKF